MSLAYTIPEGSVEIQTGLWAELRTFTVSGVEYQKYNLYSADGYCFYDLNRSENYDEEGNLLPAEERLYQTVMYTTCTTIEQLNTRFVSIPYQEGYEVVSVPTNPPVTA